MHMSWFKDIFENTAERFVNNHVKELYPNTWVECKKCGRVLKSADALKEHVKMEHE